MHFLRGRCGARSQAARASRLQVILLMLLCWQCCPIVCCITSCGAAIPPRLHCSAAAYLKLPPAWHLKTMARHRRYPVRMALVSLDDPPQWFGREVSDHMTAADARHMAGTKGKQISKMRSQCLSAFGLSQSGQAWLQHTDSDIGWVAP